MELEAENHSGVAPVSEDDLMKAFADDDGRGGFIILSQSEQVFIQAAGEPDGPFCMEYREGGNDCHYQCPEDLSKDRVQAAFIKYLNEDESWKTDFQWEQLELKDKPWWKFW